MNKTLKAILVRVVAFSALFLVCFLPLCVLFSGCTSPDGMVGTGPGLSQPGEPSGAPSTNARAAFSPVLSQPDPGAVVPSPGGSGGGGGGGGTGGIDNRQQTTDGGIAGGTGGGMGGTAGVVMDGGTDNRQQTTDGMVGGQEVGGQEVSKPLMCNYTCQVKVNCLLADGCVCELPEANRGSCAQADICDYCKVINSFRVKSSVRVSNPSLGPGIQGDFEWDVNGGGYFKIGTDTVCSGTRGTLCSGYPGNTRTAGFLITHTTTFWLVVMKSENDTTALGYASVTVQGP